MAALVAEEPPVRGRGGEALAVRERDGQVARAVLDHVAAHAPHPEAEVRLAVLMLTLRAARAGTGNVTGQDLTGWLQGDAERVVQRLVTDGWLSLPGTVAEVMASRPEDLAAAVATGQRAAYVSGAVTLTINKRRKSDGITGGTTSQVSARRTADDTRSS